MTSYTLSMRGKPTSQDLLLFISDYFDAIPRSQIDSVFGFVEQSELYGGRPFIEPELSQQDVQTLYQHNIGLRLPLSNKYVDRQDYEKNQGLLEKYHRPGNSVIVVSDDLAKWIRSDFPDYHIEASVIKNIKSHAKIKRTLALYDTVVLPAHLCHNYAFLEKIADKDSIRLFANAGCAYNCPSKICYNYIAKMNKYNSDTYVCSKRLLPRRELGMVNFDIDRLLEMGFSKFKLLRVNGITGF